MATSTAPKKRRPRAAKADKAVSARLDTALDRQFRAAAERAGVGVSDLLCDAVKQFIAGKQVGHAQAAAPASKPTEQALDQAWGAAFKARLDALEATTKAELQVQRKALEVALRLLKKMSEDGLGLDVSDFFPKPKTKPALTATQLEYLAQMRAIKAANKANSDAYKKAE